MCWLLSLESDSKDLRPAAIYAVKCLFLSLITKKSASRKVVSENFFRKICLRDVSRNISSSNNPRKTVGKGTMGIQFFQKNYGRPEIAFPKSGITEAFAHTHLVRVYIRYNSSLYSGDNLI